MISPKVLMTHLFVIPAKAGIHNFNTYKFLDSRLRGNDKYSRLQNKKNTIAFT